MNAGVGSLGRFVRRAGRLAMKRTNYAESCWSKMSAEGDSPSYLHFRSRWQHAMSVFRRSIRIVELRVLREALQHPRHEENVLQ
jgi:hypothetical protein